jgi:hypothetical protein
MAFSYINLEHSKFGNFPFKDQKKEYKEPTFQDLMYHIIRCGLIHGSKYNIKFHKIDEIIIEKNILIFPARLIWALLGIIVFCSSNKDEQTADGYYLLIFDQHFTINGWWGMEEFVYLRFQDRITNSPRITLNIPHNHFHSQSQSSEDKKAT